MKLRDYFQKPQHRPWNKWDAVALTASGLFFTVLSVVNMPRWSFWFDEAFGLYIIRSDFAELTRLTAADVHPPLYYWTLKIWTMLFGTSEIAVRSLSLIGLLIAFGFMYALVRRLFGQKAAVYSIVLMAFTPLMLRYSFEARMYGMVAAIVVASTYVFVSAMQQPKRWKWVTYGILVAMGLMTHYFTALAFFAQWVWRFVTLRQHTVGGTFKKVFEKNALIAIAIAFILFLPWLPTAAKQMSTIQAAGFWIPVVDMASPLSFVSDTLLYHTAKESTGWYAVAVWVLVILSSILAYRVYMRSKIEQKQSLNLMFIMAFVPLALIIAISLPPLRSALIIRYILASALFMVALLGILVSLAIGTPKKVNRFAAVTFALIIIAMVGGITYVFQVGNASRDDNDKMLIWPTIKQAWQKSDINEPTLVANMWRYYETAAYENRAPVGSGVFVVADDSNIWGSYEPLRKPNSAKVYDVVAFARQNGGKFWYIGDWSNDDQPILPKQGSWKVLQVVHVQGMTESRSNIRAAELQLVSE